MNELLNQPLAHIVNGNFKTAQVFERYGLDYCCRGKQTLQRACEQKGIAPNQVLSDLSIYYSAIIKENNFTEMLPGELVSYVENVHHRYVRDNAPIITGYLSKVVAKHGERYPFMKEVSTLFSGMIRELESHMEQEEQVVFPLIRQQKNSDLIRKEMKRLENEHDEAGTAMERIRDLTNNYAAPQHACATFGLLLTLLKEFETDLHKHVHLENNILFPKVA